MIDTVRLNKELNDTLIHIDCVKRSGAYLARFLISKDRSVDALRLIGRCSEHDLSKIRNLEEFRSLASIVDELDQLHDVSHELTDYQKDAIRIHWKNNSHHPEHYDSPNDMSDLDLMEMACDCHARSKQYGTDLIEFFKIQQELRFHFDKEHFDALLHYAKVLTILSRNDDYSTVLTRDNEEELKFNLYDSTLSLLDTFVDENYLCSYKTDKLVLRKEKNPDFASVVYMIYDYDGNEIGYISLKCNGVLEYKIYEEYNEKDYAPEAINKILEIATMKTIYLYVKKSREDSESIIKELGFKLDSQTDSNNIFKYKK